VWARNARVSHSPYCADGAGVAGLRHWFPQLRNGFTRFPATSEVCRQERNAAQSREKGKHSIEYNCLTDHKFKNTFCKDKPLNTADAVLSARDIVSPVIFNLT
jgi:hypothetical protein